MDPNRFSALCGGRVAPNAPHIWECINLARSTDLSTANAALADPGHPVWLTPGLFWVEIKAALMVAARRPSRPSWIPASHCYWQKADQTASVWRDGRIGWLFVAHQSDDSSVVIPVADEGVFPSLQEWESATN